MKCLFSFKTESTAAMNLVFRTLPSPSVPVTQEKQKATVPFHASAPGYWAGTTQTIKVKEALRAGESCPHFELFTSGT